MPQATIIADKIVPPKPGKKRYTIVTPDEKLFGAMPPIAERMKVGGTYDVFYKEDHFGGKTYLVIEGSTEVAGAPKPTGSTSGQTPASPSYTPKYGNQDLETAKRIFVCGALNATLGNPSVAPLDISGPEMAGFINVLMDVFDRTLGGKPPVTTAAKVETKRDDMDDEIPFDGGR